MHVAVVNLTRGGFSGGYRKYLQVLMPRLARHPRIGRLDVYLPPGQSIVMPGVESVASWPAGGMHRAYAHLRAELRRTRPDVVFIPNAQTIDCGIPVVSMIRNMEPLEAPFAGNPLGERLRNALRATMARRAAKRSDRVIAVSEHVRDFLVSRWGISPDSIGVVYHGVDRGGDGTALNVTTPFAFTAGSIRPARGLEDVVTAFCNGALPSDHSLLIGGRVDPGMEGYAEGLRRRLARAGVADRVQWLGQLGAAEMSWCFTNARLFVMTSRAEACPNTVLEAMAHRCLSVSTDQPPMPEFFRDAALYYKRADADDLARALREALSLDAAAADGLRDRALARASQFTWEATAERTVRELERVLSFRPS
jgi:glycosyltransferase involved in cell wall biosynthesis